jgi:uncharacterized protein YndB with AHSA1/START domain
MEMIEIEVVVNAPMNVVWDCFNSSEHIVGWNFASDDWHCPESEVDFQVGGKFSNKMSAQDGSFSFDFWGYYREIVPQSRLVFSLGEDLGENRMVEVEFEEVADGIKVIEKFTPEDQNSADLQRQGWQMILNNFKNYCEKQSS